MTYPIAETFYSIQGEGVYAGTPMFFVRFAGCNVGKYNKLNDGTLLPNTDTPFQLLHPEYATCTSFNNKSFICDTDYRVKERLTSEQILECVIESGAQHVCFTGGEPFIHNLEPLVEAVDAYVHIETSGTKAISVWGTDVWVTCSPKQGFLKQNTGPIDEFKFLVRNEDDEAAVEVFMETNDLVDLDNIFIQPVDELITEIDATNRQFAIECVKRHPGWRISIQAHKFLGVR